MTSVLLVDDDAAILRMWKRGLVATGLDVETAIGGALAMACLDARRFDVLLTDVSMPEIDGLAVMQHALSKRRAGAAIVVTGEASVPLAVRAIREGAADFLTKPIATDVMSELITKIAGYTSSANDDALTAWRREVAPQIIGNNRALTEVLGIVRRVADTICNVLVTGPSGTGKELIARALHDGSKRSANPFVAVNCAAIPKELMESEIFGHRKGAFTGATEHRMGRFQAADEGTLFFDEIGEMDISLQGKLLRVIQEKEVTAVGASQAKSVDVRIVAATNQNLQTLCAQGLFREDLYYRLNVIPIELPPLCERGDDILQLAGGFLQQANARHGRSIPGFNNEAKEILMHYPWPGNVREMENLVERLVVLKHQQSLIEAADLRSIVSASGRRATDVKLPEGGLDINSTLESIEIRLTQEALQRAGGNKAKAAALLGLKRTTLVERLKRLHLDSE